MAQTMRDKIGKKKKPLFLSWLQLRKERTKLLVAIAGISFADVLMFLQMGFQGALFSSAVEFHHSLDGEIVMVSSRSRALISLDRFTERRLYQAVGIAGVASVRQSDLSRCHSVAQSLQQRDLEYLCDRHQPRTSSHEYPWYRRQSSAIAGTGYSLI
jgi:hypothetical protein